MCGLRCWHMKVNMSSARVYRDCNAFVAMNVDILSGIANVGNFPDLGGSRLCEAHA